MEFRPLGDRVVILRDVASETETSIEIYIPEQAREKLNRGVVRYIGPEVKDLKVGDKVMFGKHDGVEASILDEKLLIVRENQIWCTYDTN